MDENEAVDWLLTAEEEDELIVAEDVAESEEAVLKDDDAVETLVEVVLALGLDEDVDVVSEEEVDDEFVLGDATQVPCITQIESSA